MSDYTKATNFTAKDSLPSGNPSKVVSGTEIDAEFNAIETAIATKADEASPTFSGTITTPLTASRAVATGASGVLAASATTATELGYLSGVTSAVQTQLSAKAPTASPTFSGTITTPLTASRAMVTGGSSELAVSAVTSTELGYVSGVTSAIQTQLDARLGIPRSTTTTTVAVGDKGKCIALSAGITVPNSTFAAGDAVSLYNDSAAGVTITQGSGLTLRLAGTTSTGNRTLAARGFATLWFNGASEAIISGSGVS